MSYDKENIFAKILRGEIPCDKIYEDEYVLSFKDIRPQAPSHALIIPKGEYIDINDFSANVPIRPSCWGFAIHSITFTLPFTICVIGIHQFVIIIPTYI